MTTANATAMQTGSTTGKAQLLTLSDLDGRTQAARRAKALVETIETDLGGADRLTGAQRELVTRAAVLGALIQHSEVRMLAGKKVDFSDYLAAVNVQRRVLATLGLDRKLRDVTPDLGDYVQRATA